MANPNARISRVHGSWRVRVLGYAPKFFADSAHGGGSQRSLAVARAWRDGHWDGLDHNKKLTKKERREIQRSTEHYADVAAEYGISPNYVHQIRRA